MYSSAFPIHKNLANLLFVMYSKAGIVHNILAILLFIAAFEMYTDRGDVYIKTAKSAFDINTNRVAV